MKIIVEIGANRGSDTYNFVSNSENFVYAFEPVPNMYEDLVKKFEKYNNIKLFPIAIDKEEGPAEFNIAGTGDWGCSSLHQFNPNINQLWKNRQDFVFTDKCVVDKKRLDTIIQQEGIDKIDYLWIDAQGNDLRVLESLGEKISIVTEGKCEAAYTVNLYQEVDNSVESVVNFLNQNGFHTQVVPDNVSKEADVHFKRTNI